MMLRLSVNVNVVVGKPFGMFATIKSEYNVAMRIVGIEVGKQQF